MKCERWAINMKPISASDFFDDSGYIGYTAWQCPSCGTRMEEIESYPTEGQGNPRRIRYPLAA